LVHVIVCLAVVLAYRWWGFPSLLGRSSAAGVSLGEVLPPILALSAVLTVCWPVLARLLHLWWWSMAYAPLERGEGPMRGLAVGTTGIGLMRLGAALGYLLTVMWVVRRLVMRHARRRNPGATLCHRCAYPRAASDRTPCPECGTIAPPVALGAHFALGRRLAQILRTSRGKWLLVIGRVGLVLLLLSAPLVLGLVGRLLPETMVNKTGDLWHSWFSLWRSLL